MEKKNLIVITAPSGSGKTTIVRHLLKKFPQLAFSVSATTREKREHEVDGRDYHFLSHDTFREWIEKDAFVEWEEVYTNQFYGTPHSEIARLQKSGKCVVFDIDVKGATNIKEQYGDQAAVIFIKAPSIEVIAERLRARKSESEQSLQKRLRRIEEELQFANTFDYVLVNDKLDIAFSQAEKIVEELIE